MTIAVDTRQPVGDDRNVLECFLELASIHPSDRFIFFSDHAPKHKRSLAPNIIFAVAPQPVFSFLQWPFGYSYKMRALLKQYRPDALVCTGGSPSIRTKFPLCLLVGGLCFLNSPGPLKKSLAGFYKKNLYRLLEQAATIASFSDPLKKFLVSAFPVDENRVQVLPTPVTGNYGPLDANEKQKARDQYADGKEYFLFTGSLFCDNNLVNLLKAFSFFKKRQKSNMLLLMEGIGDPDPANGAGLLKTFRFRDEVKLLGTLTPDEKARVTASAYAIVQPSLHEDLYLEPVQAMKCKVPVIMGDRPAFREICGDAALYAMPDDFMDIAEKMMVLFRDETRCGELVNAGIRKAGEYNTERSLGLLWKWITAAIETETA
jgi:glycosyltransferase involved in cell wall biosynthesis